MQAMLFAMLQEQHMKELAQMEATNKTNMEAVMEKMIVMIRSSKNPADKENTRPTGNVNPEEEESVVPQLQNFCPPQTGKLL